VPPRAPPPANPPAPATTLWDYTNLPNADATLVGRTAAILRDLRRNPATSYGIATDSRAMHRKLFAGLTPPRQNFFAGSYRGQYPEPLLSCRAWVEGEAKTPPRFVVGAMVNLRNNITRKFGELDKRAKENQPDNAAQSFLIELVEFAAATFCDFLAIHPYVNGNGHAARLVLTAVLGRYGYWLKRWSVHPRPAEPYLDVQKKYWKGDKDPLHKQLLSDLLDAPSP
jgi:fido (protein-threonine AMPylation protein)